MKVLVIGANYGLLLVGMLLERKFKVDVLANKNQVDLLNNEGFSLTYDEKIWDFQPSSDWQAINDLKHYNYDLVILAIQEPSLSDPKIGNIIKSLSKNSVTFFSIMNIPFYQFLTDVVGIKRIENSENIYSSLNFTNNIFSGRIINSNPEPQVFSEKTSNRLSIRLGGVFRCSSLDMLGSKNIENLLRPINSGLPAKIKTYNSPWVSISKLPMLITGNYRCLDKLKLRSIHQSIIYDTTLSEKIYNQVSNMMRKLGAGREAIIPFKAYLKASRKLDAPSSVCKAIVEKKQKIERVDKLVQSMGQTIGFQSKEIDDVVETIDKALLNFSN